MLRQSLIISVVALLVAMSLYLAPAEVGAQLPPACPGWTCAATRCDNQFIECEVGVTPVGTYCEYCDGGAANLCKRSAGSTCGGGGFADGTCGIAWVGQCDANGRCNNAEPVTDGKVKRRRPTLPTNPKACALTEC